MRTIVRRARAQLKQVYDAIKDQHLRAEDVLAAGFLDLDTLRECPSIKAWRRTFAKQDEFICLHRPIMLRVVDEPVLEQQQALRCEIIKLREQAGARCWRQSESDPPGSRNLTHPAAEPKAAAKSAIEF